MSGTSDLGRVDESQPSRLSPWEEAYTRFETPEREIAKFRHRLLRLGAAKWDKNLQVVELFCGRGNGLHALSRLGFQHLEGVDLSEALLAKYEGPAKCYVGDCRQLPFESESRDLVIVQGGLHHLPRIPDDLEITLAEMRRVLRPGGFAVIIEPWLTPFLRLVHAVCASGLARRFSTKIDALAIMIENERSTYEQWLHAPDVIRALLEKTFDRTTVETRWGKVTCLGHAARD
jgi:ubiquinone/menaquinone biosynthesis C-methylase UbiE